MGERAGYAQVCADRKERHASRGCAGGRHVMFRDPDGPEDRPWKCRLCPQERPWSGGYRTWLADHAPVVLAAAIVGDGSDG